VTFYWIFRIEPKWSSGIGRRLKATVSPEIRPERQAQILVNQAKNVIRNRGLTI
jgi:hypothetical protein